MQKLIGKTLLHYNTSGAQYKKTILLLPGWMDNGQNWQAVYSGFGDKYQCITPDLPGFGATIADFSKPWTVEDYSELTANFLKKIKVEPDIIIAHSFGGKIAVSITNNYKLEKLVLIAPSIAFKQKNFIKIRNLIFKLFKTPASLLGKNNKNIIAKIFGSDDYRNAGELLPTFKNVVQRKMIANTKSVRANTLIIWGSEDKQVDPDTAKDIRKLIQNSKIRIVWGGHHNLHLDNKDKLIRLLKEEGL